MRTIVSDGVAYDIVDTSVVGKTLDDDLIIQINEGAYEGVCFVINNMRMDGEDEAVMHYDLVTVGSNTPIDEIKPIVDNFIIAVLYDAVVKRENATDG